MAADLSGFTLSSTSGTIDLARQWPSGGEEGESGAPIPISVKSAVSSANNASWTLDDDGRGTSFVYAEYSRGEGGALRNSCSDKTSCRFAQTAQEADRSVAGRRSRGFPGLWMPITSASLPGRRKIAIFMHALKSRPRDLARAKNQKKQLEMQKKKNASEKTGLSLSERKHRDAELMREKQRRKDEEAIKNNQKTAVN
ncbi:Putative SERF-like protein [Eumeta japonica]|uniref:SERF-like protein n=1 Tax=Eumeta variegata TaxID=151549 RepID=A0A4C1Y1I7_EUMVA|nr:Putative SERF-like protein [Eumeta japonica]